MFIWINQGIVEPYIPRPKESFIPRINPLHAGIPERPVEVHPDHSQEKEIPLLHDKVKSAYLEEGKKETKKRIFYAKDIMSKNVVSVSPDENIETVSNLFSKNRFRHIAVVNENNTLFGIVSERDLLRLTIERISKQESTPITVRDITKKKTLTAFPITPIRDIAKIMFEERVGSVPVLSKESFELLGIVTRSDILQAVMNFPLLELYG